jgi:hypothetical protein
MALANSGAEEARALMEKVKKMRAEIAALEGKSVQDVEQEALSRKQQQEAVILKAQTERDERATKKAAKTAASGTSYIPGDVKRGSMLSVPILPKDQILQAATAVERAFQDGLTRQVVRFALMRDDENMFEREQQWPGGAQQMYREAASPLTRQLLEEIRAPTASKKSKEEGDVNINNENNDVSMLLKQAPNVTSQVVWDFDGSAVVTAEAASGAKDDVQALVFPNTDTKYTRDIDAMNKVHKERLLLLINPFWRNIDSWGINIMAPKGKQMAQDVIFDGNGEGDQGDSCCNFQETYVLLQYSVRGEECVSLKAYPHDWQLYAFLEEEYWPYEPKIIRLGETKDEPKSADFTELINAREEFKLSKNMRQLERMRK